MTASPVSPPHLPEGRAYGRLRRVALPDNIVRNAVGGEAASYLVETDNSSCKWSKSFTVLIMSTKIDRFFAWVQHENVYSVCPGPSTTAPNKK